MVSRDEPSAGDVAHRVSALEDENRALRARVEELEAGLAQERALHRRVAELTDLVQEVLLPAPQRNEGRVSRLLTQYLRDSS